MGAEPVDHFSASYPAAGESAARARWAVAEFAAAAGVEGEQLDGIRLAVSEAVTNVVLHAYAAGEGSVSVSAAIASGGLSVLIMDEGSGLRSDSPSAGLGLGLIVMERFSDGFILAERASGGLEVRLQFLLPGTVDAQRPCEEPALVAAVRRPALRRLSTTV